MPSSGVVKSIKILYLQTYAAMLITTVLRENLFGRFLCIGLEIFALKKIIIPIIQ